MTDQVSNLIFLFVIVTEYTIKHLPVLPLAQGKFNENTLTQFTERGSPKVSDL